MAFNESGSTPQRLNLEEKILSGAKHLGILPPGAQLEDLTPDVRNKIVEHNILELAKMDDLLNPDATPDQLTDEIRSQIPDIVKRSNILDSSGKGLRIL